MDLLKRGSRWLERTRTEFVASWVTLRRASSSVTVRATNGKSEFEVEDAQGVVMKVQTQDFLILVKDYRIDDVKVEPRVGDLIVDAAPDDRDATNAPVYEVAMPAKGVPAWRYSDNFLETYRVHTKLVTRKKT